MRIRSFPFLPKMKVSFKNLIFLFIAFRFSFVELHHTDWTSVCKIHGTIRYLIRHHVVLGNNLWRIHRSCLQLLRLLNNMRVYISICVLVDRIIEHLLIRYCVNGINHWLLVIDCRYGCLRRRYELLRMNIVRLL